MDNDIERFLFDEFLKTLTDAAAPLNEKKLVIGFSGGPDSTALFHLCLMLRYDFSLELYAAHLNHGLRGEEAHSDRLFAQRAAERHGVEFVWDETDCRGLAAEKSLSLEEAAREARYSFFNRIIEEKNADFVLTGHTADDNAETVLMNLLRGAGPQGLGGIPPARGCYIRPMLNIWRSEVLLFLKTKKLSWVEDRTNRDLCYLRNRVRLDLLPKLKKEYNPSIKNALVRTAHIMRAEEDAWKDIVNAEKEACGWKYEDGIVFVNRKMLCREKSGIARRLIRFCLGEISGSVRCFNMDHIETVLETAANGGGVDLPRGVRAWTEGDGILFGKMESFTRPEYEYRLEIPGRLDIPEIKASIVTEYLDYADLTVLKRQPPETAVIDANKVRGGLWVRSPGRGDRFSPLGMSGSKKLSDFFIDSKVSRRDRAFVPVIADDNKVVWIGGRRLSESVKVDIHSTRCIKISLFYWKTGE